jgi:2-succinyl-5-enolpyruvyl-6-hydroxy-3-cyclohexene-1-carboxylate synthase/pimeloyl-ACP methyl ester carboxylesterase
MELSRLISKSRRGLIVVGNVRPSLMNEGESQIAVADAISDFAEHIGFPVIAGVQQVALRFRSSCVVLFAEHLLKCPDVANNLNPDLIIQIGAPLVSTEVPSIISKSIKSSIHEASHVLIHPHTLSERVDPSFTVTRHIQADYSILKLVSENMMAGGGGSELGPLVMLGRLLQGKMKKIILKASEDDLIHDSESALSEPEVILVLAEVFAETAEQALFLSNSMTIRDSDFFLYPLSNTLAGEKGVMVETGTNRGASGIDGLISSAVGFAEATETPTTLVIGDVSALHDIGSLHNLVQHTKSSKQGQGKRRHPVISIVVNNDGGGIFSFLPIAQHGSDVSFDEFFGTPTNSFSFRKGAEAFGLPYRLATNYDAMKQSFSGALRDGTSSMFEAVVMSRESNVQVHRRISEGVTNFVNSVLIADDLESMRRESSRLTTFSNDFHNSSIVGESKTLVMLHGWMGDKTDWDEIGLSLSGHLPHWSIKAVDLAGHGAASDSSCEIGSIRRCLNLPLQAEDHDLSVQKMAEDVVDLLLKHNVHCIDAIVGYSMGARVALAIHDRYARTNGLIHNHTKLVLLSSFTEEHSSQRTQTMICRECLKMTEFPKPFASVGTSPASAKQTRYRASSGGTASLTNGMVHQYGVI